MSNLAVKEFETQANSYINISVEEYNARRFLNGSLRVRPWKSL